MSKVLNKVISTSTFGDRPAGGGLLSAEQTNQFIDYLYDGTVLSKEVRREPMVANEKELNRMGVGERIVRLATEGADDGQNVGVAFARVTLTTKKLRLDWELTEESLEDNIEGRGFESHVAQLFATQAGNDIEDLLINGDVNLTTDPLYKSFDGWRKYLYAGASVVDAAGGELDRAVFHRALKAMPRKYLQDRPSLRWYTHSSLLQDYVFSDQYVPQEGQLRPAEAGNPGLGVATSPGWSPVSPYGIPAREVPKFPEYSVGSGFGSDVWLTDPKNLIVGIKREIRIARQYSQKKDTHEFTMFTRIGAAVENPNAAVLVKNVANRD